MSKTTVVMCSLIIVSVAMAIVPVSVRMRGLNPDLVGIVDDEYSDLFFNPAFINKIDGKRVYTNLSNIHNLGEDLFFNPNYYPDMYYNLLGGITNIKDHKLGALIQTGGADWLQTEQGNYADVYRDINGNMIKELDSMNYEYKSKFTDFAINLFWGKKLNDWQLGVWTGPQFIDYEESEKYKEREYYYQNDTLFEYDLEQSEWQSKAKTNAIPLMVGFIKGEVDDEWSAALAYGYDRVNGIVPSDFVSSEMYRQIHQSLTDISEDFAKWENKYNESGYYLSLVGRHKSRCEDFSLSYLANLVYVHKPITMTYTDTSYEYQSFFASGYQEIEGDWSMHKAEGPMNHLSLGLGVGLEKYFDIENSRHLFAIGFIPSFFVGNTKIKQKPYYGRYYYYHNLPDTLEYTVNYGDGEHYDIKNTLSGFQFTIPVGLEANLTKRLVFRLGATENLMLKMTDVSEYTLADSGWHWNYHYIHGGNDTCFIESPDELDSYYYKTESKISMANATAYYYGAGYKISDNIELNFLNFADLTNLRKWILGVNIKF
ncbi:MAG: hypothetical protein ABIK33_03825 [candidate division WOR-3 bacterium]